MEEIQLVVRSMDGYSALKNRTIAKMNKYFTDENIRKIYGASNQGREKGDILFVFESTVLQLRSGVSSRLGINCTLIIVSTIF